MLVTVKIFFLSTCAFLTEIKVIKNDEDCVRVAFLPHKHLTMTDQTASRPTLSLHMTNSYVRTATRTTLKVEANLTQILNFKANFHTEFEPIFKKKIYANNGGHFKIVSIKIKN